MMRIPKEIKGDEAKEVCYGTIGIDEEEEHYCREVLECTVVDKCKKTMEKSNKEFIERILPSLR